MACFYGRTATICPPLSLSTYNGPVLQLPSRNLHAGPNFLYFGPFAAPFRQRGTKFRIGHSPLSVDQRPGPLALRRLFMIRASLAALALGTALLLSACNTVEGAGRDLQSAGDAVEDAAN